MTIPYLQCAYYTAATCRSCSLLREPDPLGHKERYVQNLLLSKIPATTEIAPLWIPKQIFPSRTKIKFSVSGDISNPIIGLVDKNFRGIELHNCPLHQRALNDLLPAIRDLLIEQKVPPYQIVERRGEIKGLILIANHDASEVIVRFILRSTESEPRIRKASLALQQLFPYVKVVSINIQPLPAAILEGPREILLTDEEVICEMYNGIPLFFGPQSFMQVTFASAQALYAKAYELISAHPPGHLLDLFCGVGGFSLTVSSKVSSSIGVELSANSISCATRSASLMSVPHVTFVAEDVEAFLATYSGPSPSTVLVNPPRRGLSPFIIEKIISLAPERIIYSSCSVESFLRDLTLLSNTYTLQEVYPFDMFPLTEHVEVLGVFEVNS